MSAYPPFIVAEFWDAVEKDSARLTIYDQSATEVLLSAALDAAASAREHSPLPPDVSPDLVPGARWLEALLGSLSEMEKLDFARELDAISVAMGARTFVRLSGRFSGSARRSYVARGGGADVADLLRGMPYN